MTKMIVIVNLFFLVAFVPNSSASGPNAELQFSSPKRSVIVNLFGWRFDDIADECEQFLGSNGFGAIQVAPVMEHAVISKPWYAPKVERPWYEVYEPVSYKIISRWGDEIAFSKMVDRCNKAGVRVIVDVVLSHMTSRLEGVGIGGTPFAAQFDGKSDFPGVPYDSSHFEETIRCTQRNAHSSKNCAADGFQETGIRLLDTRNPEVQEHLKAALNRLVDIGVAGFRIEAANDFTSSTLGSVLQGVSNLNVTYFPPNTRPFVINEIIFDGNQKTRDQASDPGYISLGRIQVFEYQQKLRNIFRGRNSEQLANVKNIINGKDFVSSNDAVVLVDNHQSQRLQSESGINFRSPKLHKLATATMLAWPYGLPTIMSSYDWPISSSYDGDTNGWMGPPTDEKQQVKHVIRRDDGGCDGGWICEHRWEEIVNMVTWRRVADNEPVLNWWDNGENQIAFTRGSKAFIVINNEGTPMENQLQTNLPPGIYCDIITGSCDSDSKCTGKTITVNDDGTAEIVIDWDEMPMIAFHVGSQSKCDTNKTPTTTTTTTQAPTTTIVTNPIKPPTTTTTMTPTPTVEAPTTTTVTKDPTNAPTEKPSPSSPTTTVMPPFMGTSTTKPTCELDGDTRSQIKEAIDHCAECVEKIQQQKTNPRFECKSNQMAKIDSCGLCAKQVKKHIEL